MRDLIASVYARRDEDDPTVPQTIRRNIAALKAIAQGEEEGEKEH